MTCGAACWDLNRPCRRASPPPQQATSSTFECKICRCRHTGQGVFQGKADEQSYRRDGVYMLSKAGRPRLPYACRAAASPRASRPPRPTHECLPIPTYTAQPSPQPLRYTSLSCAFQISYTQPSNPAPNHLRNTSLSCIFLVIHHRRRVHSFPTNTTQWPRGVGLIAARAATTPSPAWSAPAAAPSLSS